MRGLLQWAMSLYEITSETTMLGHRMTQYSNTWKCVDNAWSVITVSQYMKFALWKLESDYSNREQCFKVLVPSVLQ